MLFAPEETSPETSNIQPSTPNRHFTPASAIHWMLDVFRITAAGSEINT
jgi:hypothetical protein